MNLNARTVALISVEPTIGHLATSTPNGPRVSPVWVDLAGDELIVNSALGRLKVRSVAAEPRVSLSMVDPDDFDQSIVINGTVIDVTTDGAEEHIDRLARRYLDPMLTAYPYRQPGEQRVLLRIRIDRIVRQLEGGSR